MLLAFFTVFIFLEELDYGMHFVDYFNGKTTEAVKYEMYVEKKVRNVHNTGTINGKLKTTSYILIVLLFVALPLLSQRMKERFLFLRLLSPSRWIITTAVSLLVTNKFAFYLYKHHNEFNRSMDKNVSGFEEGMIY